MKALARVGALLFAACGPSMPDNISSADAGTNATTLGDEDAVDGPAQNSPLDGVIDAATDVAQKTDAQVDAAVASDAGRNVGGDAGDNDACPKTTTMPPSPGIRCQPAVSGLFHRCGHCLPNYEYACENGFPPAVAGCVHLDQDTPIGGGLVSELFCCDQLTCVPLDGYNQCAAIHGHGSQQYLCPAMNGVTVAMPENCVPLWAAASTSVVCCQ